MKRVIGKVVNQHRIYMTCSIQDRKNREGGEEKISPLKGQ
jgi:hypothetical protein